MKIKVKDLINIQLDWAVAKCQNIKVSVRFCKKENEPYKYVWFQTQEYSPSTNDLVWEIYSPSKTWAQAGPIIEQEKITFDYDFYGQSLSLWTARKYAFDGTLLWAESGDSPLIAAMRCFVQSILGDEVDIPEELIET